MKSVSVHTTLAKLDEALTTLKQAQSEILIVFSSVAIMEESVAVAKIRSTLPDARLIGCSTSGEIGDRVDDDSITVLGITLEKSSFKCAAVSLGKTFESRDAGKKIVQDLLRDDLRAIFVLTPGHSVNGSEFALGMKEILPHNVVVSGGLAGDGTNFKRTCVVLDDGVSDKLAVAIGFYGDNIDIRGGSSGGWKPFGPTRKVTKADKNILFELDGKPALELYKQYLGDKVKDLPGSGLLYPFAILTENAPGQKGLIRTILGIDEEKNALILAGNMDVGSSVSLMHATTAELTEGARSAALKVLNGETPPQHAAAICVSCVGRKILMGEDTEDELDAIRDEMKDIALAGFYSYGEIGHHEDTDRPELHNQTMSITYITEHV